MISTHPRLKTYCSEPLENIENYEQAVNDKEHMWHCHHRAEILPCGRYTVDQLKKHGLYWHRPASELIFITETEHVRLHQIGNKNCCGKHHSDETRHKMSESQKGRKISEETKRKIAEKMRGKPSRHRGKPHSLETRRKISEAHKGKTLSEEHRRKMSEANRGKSRNKGKTPWNKGKRFTLETRRKMSEAQKDRRKKERAAVTSSMLPAVG